MADTRTRLTTPVGESPRDDVGSDEWWVPGPRLPSEPAPPSRFRGAFVLLAVLVAVVGLTFAIAPTFLESQDPTFGGGPDTRLDQTDDDAPFERQRGG